MKISLLWTCCPCFRWIRFGSRRTGPADRSEEEEEEEEATGTRRIVAGDGFDFRENSRAMFVDVCNATPKLVRHFTRDALTRGLRERGCGAVYEKTMYDVCREVTPKKYLKRTMEILDRDRTTT